MPTLEPKPCPFCGGKPTETVTMRPLVDHKWMPTIGCRPCGFEIRRSTRSLAVRQWNRRANAMDSPDKPTEVTERLGKPWRTRQGGDV